MHGGEPQVFPGDFQRRSGEEQEVINHFTASQRELAHSKASFAQFTSQVPKHSLAC